MRAATIVLSLFALTAVVAAEAPPTLDAIIANHLAARGGLVRIKGIQSLRQKGHAVGPGGRDAVVTRELKRPGKIRFEFKTDGVTGVWVSNGKQGWQVSPFDGELEAKSMSEDALAEALEQADFDGPLVDWKAKGHKVELAGRDTVEGRPADKLKVTMASGVVRYEYLDATTHMLLRTETERTIRGHAVRVQTTLFDHTKVNGVMFPKRVEVGIAGRPRRLKIAVESIEVNAAISDARFERSKAP